jgi:signal transduction histidine kinase
VLLAAGADLPSFAYVGLRWVDRAGGAALMVYQPFRPALSNVVAVTIPESDACVIIGKLIASMPVLPASLTHGETPDSGLGMRVTSSRRTLASKGFDSLTMFRARAALDPPYADLGVEVSIAGSLAPSLVAGGLPASRMPVLVILVATSIGLTVAAGDQLRRELALSRLREDFVSSVSHELRTPLAQIRMFAETLRLRRVRTPDEETTSLGIIENEARRMEHLVENLLHFSRAERSVQRVRTAPVNLSALVHEIASEFTPLAERHGSRITLNVQPGITSTADSAALRQALLNLLDNAVKYGARGQMITVGLAMHEQRARLTVDDQGAGVGASEHDAIWERFARGEAARRTGAAGTGVGLAIVRDIVALHGGTSSVEVSPDGGARMVIELPGASVAV